MIFRKREPFKIAFNYCQLLKSDLDNLEILLAFQKFLNVEIEKSERKIRKLKSRLKAINNFKSRELASKYYRYIERKIDDTRYDRYIWKCFGDAIAFLYLDRFALKHTLYNTHDSQIKQDAGFSIDKKGAKLEWSMLEGIIKKQVPCMLTDLTNIIRFGDLCVLIGPDPQLIEVKTSKKKDRRAKRQLRRLKKLHEFYTQDEISDFRGMEKVTRRESVEPFVSYTGELNECILSAYEFGRASIEPEMGLHVFAIHENNYRQGSTLEEMLSKANLREPHAFYWNALKSAQDWGPFYPFTLQIETKQAMRDFISGDLSIIVFLDMLEITDYITSLGYKFILNKENNGEPPIKIFKEDPEKFIQLGHLFTRCGMEVLSPKWLVNSAIGRLDNFLEEPPKS